MNTENPTFFEDLERHWARPYVKELVKRQIIPPVEDYFYPEQKITTKQFIIWSLKSYLQSLKDENSTNQLSYGIKRGIIEDYDLVSSENWIERRQVARIVHDILRIEMNEKDENDWTAAKKLTDLYSCRTCVQHIAQVYIKGIVDPEDMNVFNPLGELTRAEAATVIVKMIDRTKRTPRIENFQYKWTELSPLQAKDLLKNNKKAVLFDVRPRTLYDDGHLTDSRSLPLEFIEQNPTQVADEKNVPILLYCQKGYKSRLAAELLIEEGYKKVYTIPGLDDYSYELI